MDVDELTIHKTKIQEDPDENYELRSQIYHALMPFRVKEILIVSSLYDAFIIEEEGLIAELVIGQYQHLLLSQPPRVTRVNSGEKALSKIKQHHYDMIITMAKNIGMDPFEFGKKMKKIRPDIPIILLATDRSDISNFQDQEIGKEIDKIFSWTGDPTLFLAIIKFVEDSRNVRYDTVNGNIRVLIMIEDSIQHYSMFIPLLYTEIVQQTRHSLSEDMNEMQRLLRRRARPKILLAESFEEGIYLYKKYREYILGVISDVNFKQDGKLNPNAGYEFLKMIRKDSIHMPLLMQSTDIENKEKAEEIDAYFLNKNSSTLIKDFQQFLLNHLGFGDFVFLLPKEEKHDRTIREKTDNTDLPHIQTTEIARASTMKEFEDSLQQIPLESIVYHSERNHFSNWLMARCEFGLAMKLRPKKVSDFNDLNEIREYLISVFNETRKRRQRGIITDFSQQKFEFDSSFTRLRGDSLGGKGRGLAFMRALLARYKIEKKYNNVIIKVPNTVVIGTLEFDRFISENNLYRFFKKENISDRDIDKNFLECEICYELKQNLSFILHHFKKPIAVRSSSLLEDYQNHPFAGMYSTYLLPNNHEDDDVRLKQLCQAIKLVYASVFYKDPKAYAESLSLKIEEEKMAIIIQEVVGYDFDGRYYPTFSGVAKSYNFYPISHQSAEDGIVNIAVGLGKTVVGGEKTFRFAPRYPGVLPDFSTPELALEHSQRELYAVDTVKKDVDLSLEPAGTLKKIKILDIRHDGSLDLIASMYDRNDGMIRDGLTDAGTPLVTFAGILKYDSFPLAPILEDLLHIGQKGMGSPVEFEFAVNIDPHGKEPPTFAVLQIRPFVISQELCEIGWDKVVQKQIFIRSNKAMGNGVIDTIKDIVYVPTETFDASKTVEIAEEIGVINKILTSTASPYILIGPGRWGTQDRWLGIPVRWGQISGVKVIVETALETFNIKPSQGTHFFQNMISRGIGYIDIPLNTKDCIVDIEWLGAQKIYKKMKYVHHVRLQKPLIITLNGKCGDALILKPKVLNR